MADTTVTLKRIIDLVTQSDINDGVYTIIDSVSGAVKKYPLGSFICSVAPIFDAAEDYTAEDICNYQGQLYRFTADHAAGAWTGSDVETVTLAEIMATADEVTALRDDLNNVLRPVVINAVDETDLEDGYYGSVGETLTGNFKRSVKYTPCVAGADYKMVYQNTGMHYFSAAGGGVCFYDMGKKFISRVTNQSVYNAPDNAAFLRFYIGNSYTNKTMVFEGNTNPGFYVPYAIEYKTSYQIANEENIINSFENEIDVSDGINKTFEEQTLTTIDGKFIDIIGTETATEVWKYGYIECKPNTTYKTRARGASACYRVYVLDNYGRLINHYPSTPSAGIADDEFKTPYNASKIIINGNSGDVIRISELTQISVSQSNNILSGKKLYCGGDSITEGANVGAFPDGYKKTYGGYVAERNGMAYVSDGIGGSCMGNVMIDGWNYNAFCVNRYQNIPTDADFITLWFGWNDNAYGWRSMREAYCVETYGAYYSALTEAQQAEVDAYKTWRQWLADYAGDVNSTSDTTWSGAWSKVLTWLLDNCSNARIGVVIAYGMNTELSNALIAVCEKFGVSYVKSYEPHEFFSVGHSQNIGTDQATKRKALYTLDNTHPNELGYEMMSASYEQFLKRL